jgi:hypothetical protein
MQFLRTTVGEKGRLMSIQRFAVDAALPGRVNRSTAATARTPANSWSVAQRGRIIEVGYGSESDFPQYAALHTGSSFLRLNYGPRSAWGTSIILLPSFWLGGSYCQGAQITVAWRNETADLVMSFKGSISGLQTQGQIRLTPPGPNLISGSVMVKVDGDVNLDCRPGEAFKPVVLSSMHISVDHWDAKSAHVDAQSFQIPDRGWIMRPSAFGRRLALNGGSSVWKINAPTLEIVMNEAREITGWKSDSFDPNDDNLSLWAATDQVLRFWEYTFTAKP